MAIPMNIMEMVNKKDCEKVRMGNVKPAWDSMPVLYLDGASAVGAGSVGFAGEGLFFHFSHSLFDGSFKDFNGLGTVDGVFAI